MNIEEIKKQYPEFQKEEAKNPLHFGDKINKWTILYRTNNSKHNAIQYVCQCECGTIAVVTKTTLINNKSKNCKYCGGLNLLGQRFGKLIVVSKSENKNGRGYWHCKCDCGNECDINTNLLTSGQTQSCGCLHKEIQHKRRDNLIGQKFGKLTPLYPIISNKGDKQTYWHCKCDCGNECDVKSTNLRNGDTKSCGCLQSFEVENIIKLLNENNIPFKKEYCFEDLKDEKPLKFDFAIFQNDKLFYLIEFDGEQHFKYKNTGWNTQDNFIKRRKHDLMKNTYCFEHNIPLIRIPYNKKYKLEDLILETTTFLFKKENEKEYYSLQ